MSGMTILGAAQISACGAGMDALREGLGRPPAECEWSPTMADGGGPRAPYMRARSEGLDDVVAARRVRRLDDFNKNFIYAACMALADGGVTLPAPERVGVVIGSGYGSMVTSLSLLDDIVRVGDDAGSPFKFTTAVNNSSATSTATYLDARGPCVSVLGFQDILLNVLRVATWWLDEGRADLVIAGAGDEFHPLVGYGMRHLGGWPEDGRMRPLNFEATTFVPGETFMVMALGREGLGRGTIEEIRAYDDLKIYRPVPGVPQILAADGRPETATAYRAVLRSGATVAAYAPLWGGNPSAEALSLLVALLTLERGRWFSVPGEADGVTPAGNAELASERIACVAANRDGSGSVVIVRA